MKQIYKAVDCVDACEAYFMLDDANKKYSVISASVCDSDEDAINFLTSHASLLTVDHDKYPRRADMIDPILLVEWN